MTCAYIDKSKLICIYLLPWFKNISFNKISNIFLSKFIVITYNQLIKIFNNQNIRLLILSLKEIINKIDLEILTSIDSYSNKDLLKTLIVAIFVNILFKDFQCHSILTNTYFVSFVVDLQLCF